ncbi:MAG: TetR/AcrR family transcriptional regulator [Christensenella sp.]|uniref:TetR/AcrR family transcriptional regulator n=1 Tax=Christensenella sp. TaxID=1935934 RepID=UPI002B22070B|nr:TetR/AcrR family transcriptional regulator [Christensenella sp.]MEA5003496.1 TetR/AcrR family transcriptional regulator [Christensenella sp.]
MAERNTKARIKQIGLNLFRERGFEDVTINEICEASGVNKHTFYYYFKSKDDLLDDFHEMNYDINTEYFMQILNAENFVEQLWFSYKPFFEHLNHSGTEIARQLFIKNLNRDVGTFRIDERRDASLKLQQDIIEKAQEAGEMRNSSDPKMLLSLMHQSLMSTAFAWVMSGGKFQFDEAARAEMEVLLDVKPALRKAEHVDLDAIWRDWEHNRKNMREMHRHCHPPRRETPKGE